MSTPMVSPLLNRTLSAVYRFYDAFLFPLGESALPIASPLQVSIPKLRWDALRSDDDLTYRFSCSTLTGPPISGLNFDVSVVAAAGDFINFEPISLTLPLPVSTPPLRSDFLIPKPLWPAVSFRPPEGETAIRGQLKSPTSQPVADIKIEMWTGVSPTPPPGTPYTRSDAKGSFLYRLPLLPQPPAPAVTVTMHLRLNGGLLAATPASLAVVWGATQIFQIQRT